METWIANASPLILLAKAGQPDLLMAEGRSVLVPDPVADEVLAGTAGDPARAALESGWGQRVPVAALPDRVAALNLDKGEASVLAVACEQTNSVVVLDDERARRAARVLGMDLIGTLGVVLLAKRQGCIPLAAPVIQRLRAAGLYISDAAVRTALVGVGEHDQG